MSADGFVSVKLDLSDVEPALANLALRDRLFTKAFRALTAPVRTDQREHAASQAGPEGSWPARAASTLARYAHGGHRTPKPMGRLPKAVAYKATAQSLSAISRVAWSAVQQDGGRVGRGSKLPPRPFLWASDKLLAAVVNHFADVYLGAFGGA